MMQNATPETTVQVSHTARGRGERERGRRERGIVKLGVAAALTLSLSLCPLSREGKRAEREREGENNSAKARFPPQLRLFSAAMQRYEMILDLFKGRGPMNLYCLVEGCHENNPAVLEIS